MTETLLPFPDQDLLDKLKLSPATRKSFESLHIVPRAYALAKVAYEAAHERSMAEQKELVVAFELEYPAPDLDAMLPDGTPDDQHDAIIAQWTAANKIYYDTAERKKLAGMCDEIVQRSKVCKFKEYYNLAEKTLVEWAKERMQKQWGARFEPMSHVFETYFKHELYGDLKTRFVDICFRCPNDLTLTP